MASLGGEGHEKEAHLMETTAKVKHVREEVTKKVRGFSLLRALLCDFLSMPLKCFSFNSTFPLSLSLSLLLSLSLSSTHIILSFSFSWISIVNNMKKCTLGH